MKTSFIKFIASFILCFCFMGITQSLAASIFADDFDSYPAMVLPQGKQWPSPIPDTESQYWTTGYYGTNAIVDATLVGLGRSGNVYGSSRGTDTSEANAFSKTFSPSSYTNANWKLTFDIYIETLTGQPATGADVLNIFSTSGTGDFNTTNSIGKVFVYELDGAYKIGVTAGSALGVISYTYFGENIDTGKWYTVSITGNNTAQTLNFTLTDGIINLSINNKSYLKDTHEFDGFVIGNTANVISGSYYLDNISVVSEP